MKKKRFTLGLSGLLLLCFAFQATAQNITTVVGCGIGDDSLATHAELVGPVGVTMDAAGNTYIVDGGSYRVRKVNTAGVITTIAGTGIYGNTGDGGPATAAQMGVLYGIAADRTGNVYVVDNGNNCIRKISSSGIISTIAGTGVSGFTGDGGPATAARLNSPIDIVADTLGNLFFTDWLNNRVRKINSAGIISTVVGNGGTGGLGNGGPATASSLGRPFRVALDRTGNLYVASVIFQCICKVDTAGNIHIVAGTGAYNTGADGDGGAATAATMTSPCGLAIDTSGHLYFSDIGNDRIRMVDLNTGIISNYAASTALGAGYSGDGGPATNAQICTPEGLFCDPAGNLLICDADNNRVRKVAAGTMSTFAGQNALFGEGFPATNAEICLPANMNCDATGNVYIADYQNNRVRKYSPSTGLLTTVAGSGIGGYDDGYSGDGGPATAANMYNPYGVAVDGAGNIYVADLNNARIRKVNTSGIITTIAGTGVSGYSGNHSAATGAELGGPAGLALDNAGNLYMADVYNNCVRKIDNAGIITTVAGNTFAGYASDNVAATATPLNTPLDVAVDANNNLYIADNGNNRIRKVDTAGIITTVAGGNTAGYSGDNGPATAAQLRGPNSIKTDAYGDIFFTDGGNQCVRMINAAGYISTIAGTTATGFSGDGGPAIAASFNGADGLAVDNAGNVYIADGNNYRVRKVQLPNLSVPVVSNLNRVAAFPNPTNGPVNIINAQGCDYRLYDEAGRQVLGGRMQSARETFDLKGRASGLYTLQVSNTLGDKKTIRIILE